MKKLFFVTIFLCFCLLLTSSACAEELVQETPQELSTETVVESDATLDEEDVDRLISLGEDLREEKESSYTWEERLRQLLDPDKLGSLLGAAMTVISSMAIFIFRHFQKKDASLSSARIRQLEAEVAAEREENIGLRADVQALILAMKENTAVLGGIKLNTEENRESAKMAKDATAATAKMVADAFGRSRTIDAATKELITYDYLSVLKAGEEAPSEEA